MLNIDVSGQNEPQAVVRGWSFPNAPQWALAFLFALALAMVMALISKIDAHPDEIWHIRAAEYYIDHWHPPAVGEPATLGSYSQYGLSYLNERDIVYFFAGKFARILALVSVAPELAIRLFNVIQFGGLCLLFFLRPSVRPGLGLCLLSPQVWYVYSYFNSDAFPLTIGFALAFLFGSGVRLFGSAGQGSALKSSWSGFALVAVGLVILALSKRNYLVLVSFLVAVAAYRELGREAGLAFLFGAWILALRDFPSLSQNAQYAAVIGLGLPGAWLLFRVYRRDFESGHSIRFFLRVGAMIILLGLVAGGPSVLEMLRPIPPAATSLGDMVGRTAKAEYLASPTSPPSYRGLSLREKGEPFYAIFVKPWYWPVFFAASASGMYGYMSIRAPWLIYVILWSSYLALAAAAIRAAVRVPDTELRDLALMIVLSAAGLTFAAAYHSWTNDFQAQGRYILPILPMIAIIAPRLAQRMDPKMLTWSAAVAVGLSFISFAFVGLGNIPKAG